MPFSPSQTVIDYLKGPHVVALRRLDIFESDGVTPFLPNAPLVDGSVSARLDSSVERRSFSCTIDGPDIQTGPGQLWYDKVFRPFRGIRHPTEGELWWPLGVFLPDRISKDRAKQIGVTARDRAKLMEKSEFLRPTSFTEDDISSDVLRSLAINAGARRVNVVPGLGRTLNKEFGFERGMNRWEAIKQISEAFSYEAAFDATDTFQIRPFADPTSSISEFEFGPGSLEDFERSSTDSRMANIIQVVGEATDIVPPVSAIARNDDPTSPTSTVSGIGERVRNETSAFITTTKQAQERADAMLSVWSLEQWEFSIQSIVVPWLEVGSVVTFNDPDPGLAQPHRLLLTDLEIPMGLAPMNGKGRRVRSL